MRDNLKDKIYGNISYNTNEIISKANTIAIMSCGIGASLLPHTSDSLLASLLLLGANIINVSYAIFSRNSESHTKEVQKIKTLYQEFLSEYVKLNRIFEFQNPIEIYTFFTLTNYELFLLKYLNDLLFHDKNNQDPSFCELLLLIQLSLNYEI